MHKAGFMRAVVAGICAIALTATAFADIKSFNAAVKVGDYKTAAAEAEQIWNTWDKSDRDTAVMAGEFGFAAVIAGRNDLALEFGRFLVENGASLPVADKGPLTSAVLYRMADYRIGKSKAQLDALRTALHARSGAAGFDMISVVAWELLYVSESTAGDWEKSATDALAAAQYLSRHSGLVARQRSAELHAASVQFIRGRGQIAQGRNNYYETIADVHDRIVADLEAASSQSDRAALWPLKWRAEAWTLAIESYLTSNYEQIESHISTKLRPRELARPTMGEIAEDPALAQIPFCDGEFEGKKMTYPSSKAYVGLVGSVIARLETDAKGKVVKVAVAAAVPGDGFGESVAKTLSTWSFKPAKGVDTSTCRMETRNRYYKVIFFIE